MYLILTFQGFQCLFSNDFELEGFEELVNFYLSTDIQTVKAELNLWKTKLSRIGKSPRTGLDAIKFCNRELFPNVFDLLQIFCTLPGSTATPERMFSCLKRLKTYLRNSMVEVNILYCCGQIFVHIISIGISIKLIVQT